MLDGSRRRQQRFPRGERRVIAVALRLVWGAAHSSAMPKPELLETFPNPYPGRDYEIAMECPEFTALCPIGGIESDADELRALKGGAPDFGTIYITYVPNELCIELKSLKLYLWSFRDDGIFYERAVNRILDDLSTLSQPRWMEVVGDFNIRGGIKSVIRARVGARAQA
jgi:7-cyano-7-deazaguanine reductase